MHYGYYDWHETNLTIIRFGAVDPLHSSVDTTRSLFQFPHSHVNTLYDRLLQHPHDNLIMTAAPQTSQADTKSSYTDTPHAHMASP